MTILLNRITRFISICMIITYTYSVLSNETLNIKSDHLTIKKNDLSATFEGSVVLTFDGLKLYSSELKIFYTDISTKRDIKQIIIPNSLKAVRNCGQEVLFADSGHFDNSTKKLTLTGNVRMLKEGNVLVTDKLVYSAKFESISQKYNAK
jgi:lipopolysaccharide transport protein LptA